MYQWIDIINFAFGVAGLTQALTGFLLSYFLKSMGRRYRNFFLIFFGVMALYVIADLVSQLSFGLVDSGLTWLSELSLFVESFLSSLLLPLFTLLLLNICGEKWNKSTLFRVMAGLWIVYYILLLTTQFTTGIYYFSNDNAYHRGPYYPLLLIPPVLMMAANVIGLYRRRKILSTRQLRAFALNLLIPLAASLIQMLFYGLLLIVIATTLSALIMFTEILRDLSATYIEQTKELNRQKMSNLVLQMRPHFIYNTMTSIYYLCGMDPEKARKLVGNFTVYLRNNFNALTKEDLIPFDKELEHTRAYLAVEKVRYKNLLYVGYDIKHTAFQLPPLTIQPIVENAVKHGVDPELSPLSIRIRTRHRGEHSIIIVEDNGPGYKPAEDEGLHVAIKNIRERLRLMCNGKLRISPREGGGTIVTIWI